MATDVFTEEFIELYQAVQQCPRLYAILSMDQIQIAKNIEDSLEGRLRFLIDSIRIERLARDECSGTKNPTYCAAMLLADMREEVDSILQKVGN